MDATPVAPINQAISAATTAEQHAERARDSADQAEDASKAAKQAQSIAEQAAGLSAEPSYIYAIVIGILGAALIALVIAMVISALRGTGTVSTDIVSAVTLIIGGLIGVLAPTPATKKPAPKSSASQT